MTQLETELAAARSLVESLEKRLAEIELLPDALLREAFNGNWSGGVREDRRSQTAATSQGLATHA